MRAALRPVAWLAIASGVAITKADPDLWGHVRFGLDLLRDRVLHANDPYSYTRDREWVNHEWLSELIAAVAFRLGGPVGLIVMKVFIAVTLFWLVWRAVRDRAFAWRWGAMALTAFVSLPLLLTARPQLWTLLGILITCRILNSPSPRALWALPLVFALWPNLHGGWLVGGGIIALWTAVAVVQRERRAWDLAATGTASLAATLLTPYGLEMWRFLLETVRFGRTDISEWQPIWKLGADSVLLWSATVVFLAYSWRRAGRPPVAIVVVLGALALAAARVDRLGPLFGLAMVILLARTWPAADDALPLLRGRAVVDALAVVVGVAALLAMQPPPNCVAIDSVKGPDTVAAESLRGRTGRVATFFDWGEYAIWQFGPALKVSLDGRRETVYSEDTLRQQTAIATGSAVGLTVLARAQPEYVWLPNESRATEDWLRMNGYRIDVRTARSFVAARSDQAPLDPWEGRPSGCFPGP